MDVREIPIGQLHVSALNTRKDLQAGQEDSGVRELAASIERQGLLSPLNVRETVEGHFEVISGQRRLEACRLLGRASVACVVREGMSDAEAVTASLVENIHRADMNPLDKARALGQLYDRLGSYARVAEETGWSASTVSKYVALLELPDALQARVGTRDGAGSVATLSRLARHFSGDEALGVYEVISGFNGRIQQEIIKRSGGDAGRITALADEARQGAFDTTPCGGAYGCEVVGEILRGEMSFEDFGARLDETAASLGLRAIERVDARHARDVWKRLAQG